MKIYFTASFSGGGKNKTQYKKIVKLLSTGKNEVTGQEVLLEKPEVNGDEAKHQQIFAREKERIEKAQAVVAEVTHPSFGVGSEVAYALTLEKPVLALFYKDSPNKLSPMIRGNPSDSLYLEHYDDDNVSLEIKKFLEFVKTSQKKKGRLITKRTRAILVKNRIT